MRRTPVPCFGTRYSRPQKYVDARNVHCQVFPCLLPGSLGTLPCGMCTVSCSFAIPNLYGHLAVLPPCTNRYMPYLKRVVPLPTRTAEKRLVWVEGGNRAKNLLTVVDESDFLHYAKVSGNTDAAIVTFAAADLVNMPQTGKWSFFLAMLSILSPELVRLLVCCCPVRLSSSLCVACAAGVIDSSVSLHMWNTTAPCTGVGWRPKSRQPQFGLRGLGLRVRCGLGATHTHRVSAQNITMGLHTAWCSVFDVQSRSWSAVLCLHEFQLDLKVPYWICHGSLTLPHQASASCLS